MLGVLIYGIAEASTAYLITKITDPPPTPENSAGFAEKEQTWENKHQFLNLSLKNLDAAVRSRNVDSAAENPISTGQTSSYKVDAELRSR